MQALDADLDRLLQLEREDAIERARTGLLAFILWTKPDYQVNWHHVEMCAAVNAFIAGDIDRLIIQAPPRHGKSEITSRRLAPFMLGMNPDIEFVLASYGASLVQAMGRDAQRVMGSPEYAELFPDVHLPRMGHGAAPPGTYTRTSTEFEIVGHRGRFQGAGIGGSLTGRGADVLVIDDYLRNWQDAVSQARRNAQWDWYNSVAKTRLSKVGRVLITATRWHQDDLIGRCLAKAESDPEADQWVVITLPAIREDKAGCPGDKRKVGEALWPERFPVPVLEGHRKNSERIFCSLYQCRPSPAEGNIVKRAWWRYYRPSELPAVSRETISVDLTFHDGDGTDFTCIQVWGCHGADRYALHQVTFRGNFVEQTAVFLQVAASYPKSQAKIVEKKANGAALIATLAKTVQGLIPLIPTGSKVARAESVSPQIEAGNVYLPHPDTCTWSAALVEQWATFPNGTHDDMVDACSQALHYLSGPGSSGFNVMGSSKKSLWSRGV